MNFELYVQEMGGWGFLGRSLPSWAASGSWVWRVDDPPPPAHIKLRLRFSVTLHPLIHLLCLPSVFTYKMGHFNKRGSPEPTGASKIRPTHPFGMCQPGSAWCLNVHSTLRIWEWRRGHRPMEWQAGGGKNDRYQIIVNKTDIELVLLEQPPYSASTKRV